MSNLLKEVLQVLTEQALVTNIDRALIFAAVKVEKPLETLSEEMAIKEMLFDAQQTELELLAGENRLYGVQEAMTSKSKALIDERCKKAIYSERLEEIIQLSLPNDFAGYNDIEHVRLAGTVDELIPDAPENAGELQQWYFMASSWDADYPDKTMTTLQNVKDACENILTTSV